MTAPPWEADEAYLAAVVADDPASPSSWRPVDLTGYLDGSHTPPAPSLLTRADGPRLLYPARVHWCSGEPEAGKSWLALLACAEVLHAAGRVVYVDLEDGPGGITGRLLALGVHPDRIAAGLVYLSPDGPLGYAARQDLAPHVRTARLLVVDACTEALALQGLSSKDDTDIATWLNLLPRWAAKHGPAVLVLDHVVKDSETRGRWATGSQHKLAGLDGAAYTLEQVSPGGVGMTSRSRLYVSKDRHGQIRPHGLPSSGGKTWIGDVVIDSTGPFTDGAIEAPAARTEPFLPTAVMEKVAAALTGAPEPLSARGILRRPRFSAAPMRVAALG